MSAVVEMLQWSISGANGRSPRASVTSSGGAIESRTGGGEALSTGGGEPSSGQIES
ncbi:hypothetical protein AAD018_006680 [Aestuariibius insulae]